MPYPVGARDAVFMRVSRRFFTGLNSPTHEKMTTIITLSQTCGLHPGIQQVTEGQLPRFYERGPIEATSRNAVTISARRSFRASMSAAPLKLRVRKFKASTRNMLPRFYERGPIEATISSGTRISRARFRASMSAAPLKLLERMQSARA